MDKRSHLLAYLDQKARCIQDSPTRWAHQAAWCLGWVQYLGPYLHRTLPLSPDNWGRAAWLAAPQQPIHYRTADQVLGRAGCQLRSRTWYFTRVAWGMYVPHTRYLLKIYVWTGLYAAGNNSLKFDARFQQGPRVDLADIDNLYEMALDNAGQGAVWDLAALHPGRPRTDFIPRDIIS